MKTKKLLNILIESGSFFLSVFFGATTTPEEQTMRELKDQYLLKNYHLMPPLF